MRSRRLTPQAGYRPDSKAARQQAQGRRPWEDPGIELTKTTEGAYLSSDPNVRGAPPLWGKPIVASTAMPLDRFLVGDFQSAATLFDRELPVLDVGTAEDDFLRNLVRLRLEERISLAVQLPGALITGDFGLGA